MQNFVQNFLKRIKNNLKKKSIQYDRKKYSFDFGYGHKIMIELGVYFEQNVQSDILLWPNR